MSGMNDQKTRKNKNHAKETPLRLAPRAQNQKPKNANGKRQPPDRPADTLTPSQAKEARTAVARNGTKIVASMLSVATTNRAPAKNVRASRPSAVAAMSFSRFALVVLVPTRTN